MRQTNEITEGCVLYSLQGLIERNVNYKIRFRNSNLFKLMKAKMFESSFKKTIFLSYFQIWSNYFQKAMLLKTAFCEDKRFSSLFYTHFKEEYNHHQMLKNDRLDKTDYKDAILEAICNWFPSKMLSYDLYEQIVVMNLCVEACAVIFYEYARPAIDPDNIFNHFQSHDLIDCQHEKMGLDLLDNLAESQYKRLYFIQEETWSMLEALMQRLSELVTKDTPKNTPD